MISEIRDYLENRINQLNAELVDFLNKNPSDGEISVEKLLTATRKDEIRKALAFIEEIRERDE